MSQDELKKRVAQAAVDLVLPKLSPASYLGVGTGSTANFFIDLLAEHNGKFKAAVSSSEATSKRLQAHGITVVDLNDIAEPIEVYVDGADEVRHGRSCNLLSCFNVPAVVRPHVATG